MTWPERIRHYHAATGFPESLFVAGNGECVGIWVMGNDYRVKSQYYGGYPAGYLRRVKALFPEKERVLHLFSGRVDTREFPGITIDINPATNPDYVDNVEGITCLPISDRDLVLADPPYSAEDCEHYGTPMVNRNKVMADLSMKLSAGCHVVWLDQVLPMYRKDRWRVEARIGMSKSTNHRFRLITVFCRL